MTESVNENIGAALGRIPSGLFILTTQWEEHRGGMLVSWVQQVCFQPPMISVALAKGRSIIPLITCSRQFGLCQLSRSEKTLLRKFAGVIKDDEDPFLGLDLIKTSKLPILAGALSYLECEVASHIDVDGDHELFVGRVVAGAAITDDEPIVHLRDNGFKY